MRKIDNIPSLPKSYSEHVNDISWLFSWLWEEYWILYSEDFNLVESLKKFNSKQLWSLVFKIEESYDLLKNTRASLTESMSLIDAETQETKYIWDFEGLRYEDLEKLYEHVNDIWVGYLWLKDSIILFAKNEGIDISNFNQSTLSISIRGEAYNIQNQVSDIIFPGLFKD